jgi:hypothetical protein
MSTALGLKKEKILEHQEAERRGRVSAPTAPAEHPVIKNQTLLFDF